MQARRYRYVGPRDVRARAGAVNGAVVDGPAVLQQWLAGLVGAEACEPVTFVIAPDGLLRVGPRRSEHVALAGGRDVLAAGEITFAPAATGWRVTEVTNQSTGYCPDPDCWPAVRSALDVLGIPHPADFTIKVIFRRCTTCGERNIVRDDDFTCALCESSLPAQWNFVRSDPGS